MSEELIPTRKSLIDRLKNWEDAISWQEFFDTYWKLIYIFARKAGLTDSESQDVVQETMVSVAKCMPRFQYNPAIGSFKAWLFRLVRWRIVDQFRKRGAELQTLSSETATSQENEAGAPNTVADDFEERWDAEWKEHLLGVAKERVKKRIDPEKYQVFELYVTREMPAERVASLLRISVDQVYLAKNRISQLITDELERLQRELY